MAYKLTFADIDPEKSFFDYLTDYTVGIGLASDKLTTYVVQGSLGWDQARGMSTLPVRFWDEENDQPSEGTGLLFLTGDETIHIF